MITKKLERLLYAAALVLVALMLAACAIRLVATSPKQNLLRRLMRSLIPWQQSSGNAAL